MSAPIAKETALYVPDVESRHQPGTYHDLIAAFTSFQNQCAFCTQAHAAAASELYDDADLVWTALRDLDRAPRAGTTKRSTLRSRPSRSSTSITAALRRPACPR